MVVCLHAQIMIPGFHKIFPSVVGRSGVDIFFAISGFVMVYVTSSRLRSPKEFILARIIRIVPVYWFYTFGVMLLMVVAPTFAESIRRQLKKFNLPSYLIGRAESGPQGVVWGEIEPWD